MPVRYGSGNPEGPNLTGWKFQGRLEKQPPRTRNESSPMVCVRFLRTQQRVKSQCIIYVQNPRRGMVLRGCLARIFSHDLSSWLGFWFPGFFGAWVLVIQRRV